MAASSRRTTTRPNELQIHNRWRDKDTSPERTMIWTDPPQKSSSSVRLHTNHVAALMTTLSSYGRVPVVYYLCRNGQLEHPHFMEVPISSPDGLFLSDVIDRLNLLRGRDMASMYSWSSKRSYKNCFVWHDLTANDFIHPTHGTEYVLKGSELQETPSPLRTLESVSFRSPKTQDALKSGCEVSDFPVARRRNQSWSSIDLGEYKVYKTESSGELNPKPTAHAATQTVDKSRRRSLASERREEDDEIQELEENESGGIEHNTPNKTTELNPEEISPPPSDSSPETMETPMKADKCLMQGPVKEAGDENSTSVYRRRLKASSVLMQLLSCGSHSFRDCGENNSKDQAGTNNAEPAIGGNRRECSSLKGIQLEEKEYFSGSLIETQKEQLPSLKRSNSYNANR